MAGLVAAPAPMMRDAVPRVLHITCFALCVANVAWIAGMYASGTFLLDALGRPLPADFLNVWAAGKLVQGGQPATAYDWAIHKQMENAAVGYDFSGHFGWHYPPPFLFVAALLAVFPYPAAFLIWIGATLPIYLAAVRGIVGQPFGWMAAAGFPPVIANVVVGQNGFLTASLIGGTLYFMERRPVLSGICLGLLTYKPHFGLLFPLVLVVARKWTVFFTAAFVGLALAALSWLAFGIDSWKAFLEWLPATSQAFLSDGKADLSKQQSLFAFVRVLGGAEAVAWTFQAVVTAAVAVLVCILWRTSAPYELKAAALSTATLIVAPYLYLYDVVVLAIAVAFLIRLGLRTGFRTYELAGLGAATALLLSFPFMRGAVALGAAIIILLLVALRAWPAVANWRTVSDDGGGKAAI